MENVLASIEDAYVYINDDGSFSTMGDKHAILLWAILWRLHEDGFTLNTVKYERTVKETNCGSVNCLLLVAWNHGKRKLRQHIKWLILVPLLNFVISLFVSSVNMTCGQVMHIYSCPKRTSWVWRKVNLSSGLIPSMLPLIRCVALWLLVSLLSTQITTSDLKFKMMLLTFS